MPDSAAYLVKVNFDADDSPAIRELQSIIQTESAGGFGNRIKEETRHLASHGKYHPTWTDVTQPGNIKATAFVALLKLKPDASTVLPLLTNRLGSADLATRREATLLLACLGQGAEKGAPYIIKAIQDGDEAIHRCGVSAAGRIGPAARLAVPALIDTLGKTNYANRISAANALGRIGANATNALPMLRQLLATETNTSSQLSLAASIVRISPDQTQALRVLINAATKGYPAHKASALLVLGSLQSGSKVSTDLLQPVLDDPALLTSPNVVPFLQKFYVPANILITKLSLALNSTNVAIQGNAADQLLLLDSGNIKAVSVLADMARTPLTPALRILAIERLGRAGTNATSAIPALKIARHDPDASVREATESALQKIAPSLDLTAESK